MALPDDAGELILLAVADLEAVEQMPETYRVDMGVWHDSFGGICEVCLAGSVIARTLGKDPSITTYPSLFSFETEDKLRWLDRVQYKVACKVGSYESDPEQFKAALRKRAEELRGIQVSEILFNA